MFYLTNIGREASLNEPPQDYLNAISNMPPSQVWGLVVDLSLHFVSLLQADVGQNEVLQLIQELRSFEPPFGPNPQISKRFEGVLGASDDELIAYCQRLFENLNRGLIRPEEALPLYASAIAKIVPLRLIDKAYFDIAVSLPRFFALAFNRYAELESISRLIGLPFLEGMFSARTGFAGSANDSFDEFSLPTWVELRIPTLSEEDRRSISLKCAQEIYVNYCRLKNIVDHQVEEFLERYALAITQGSKLAELELLKQEARQIWYRIDSSNLQGVEGSWRIGVSFVQLGNCLTYCCNPISSDAALGAIRSFVRFFASITEEKFYRELYRLLDA